jgi:mycothiol synthase
VGALTAELVVEPARREHGFGRRLLGAIFDLARTEGAGEVHLWAYGDLPPARHLAEQCHCRPERVLLQYGLERARLPTRPGRRADVRLRRFEPSRDAYSWLVQHQRVFAGHPEQSAWDATDLQLRLDQPWFEAQDFLIAEDARSKAMLGFCWTKLPLDADQPGEIYIVGVDPGARGRGLGQLLTWAGLAHIRARGRPGATLYVEADNAPARRLYEGFGFRVQHTHVCYRHSAF